MRPGGEHGAGPVAQTRAASPAYLARAGVDEDVKAEDSDAVADLGAKGAAWGGVGQTQGGGCG